VEMDETEMLARISAVAARPSAEDRALRLNSENPLSNTTGTRPLVE
jgi:hypothetical protein